MQHMEGFETPIYRSLTEKMMIAGVPRELAIVLGTLATMFGLGLHSWYVLPVFVVCYFAAARVHKKDPQAFDVFRRHIRMKRYYST